MAHQQLLSQLLLAAWKLEDTLTEVAVLPDIMASGQQSPPFAAGSSQQDSIISQPASASGTSHKPHPAEAKASLASAAHDSAGNSGGLLQMSQILNPALGMRSASRSGAVVAASQQEAYAAQPEVSHEEDIMSDLVRDDNLIYEAGQPTGQQGCVAGSSRMDLLVHAWSQLPPGLEAEAFQLLDLASEPPHVSAILTTAQNLLEKCWKEETGPCMMATAKLAPGGRQGPSQVPP